MESLYFGLETSPEDKIKCVALCDYTPQRQHRRYMEGMMTFREGDKFLILDNSDEFGLWLATSLSTDIKGWIPSSFVMPETEL